MLRRRRVVIARTTAVIEPGGVLGELACAPPLTLRFGKDANWEDLAKTVVARTPARAVVFAGKARDWVELRRKMPARW